MALKMKRSKTGRRGKCGSSSKFVAMIVANAKNPQNRPF